MHQPFSFIHNTIKSAIVPKSTAASGIAPATVINTSTSSPLPSQHDTVANAANMSACRPECGCDGVTPSAFVLYGQYVTKYHSHHNSSSRRFLAFSAHTLHWDVRQVGGNQTVAMTESRFAHVSQLVGAYGGKYVDRFETATAQNRLPTERSMTVVVWRGSAMHVIHFECQDQESRDKWVDNINSLLTQYKYRHVTVSLGGQLIQHVEADNQHTQLESPHRAEGVPPSDYTAYSEQQVTTGVTLVRDISASSEGMIDIESDSAAAEEDQAEGCGETLAEALHIDNNQSQYHSRNILHI
jgi:hypothetical protein